MFAIPDHGFGGLRRGKEALQTSMLKLYRDGDFTILPAEFHLGRTPPSFQEIFWSRPHQRSAVGLGMNSISSAVPLRFPTT